MNNKSHIKLPKFAVLIAAGLGLLSTSAVHAAPLIDVNFTNGSAYSGAAAIGSAGDHWNNLLGLNSTSGALVDTSGTPIVSMTQPTNGVTITTSGFTSNIFGYNSYDNLALNLFGYGLYTTPSTTNSVLTFKGLAANTTYQLELYISNYSFTASPNAPSGLGRIVSFTTNDGTATADSSASATFVDGGNYVAMQGTTDNSGQLVIDALASGANAGGEIDIMGVQLQAQSVPEPSTAAMAVPAITLLLAFVACQRRRHARI